MTCFSSRYLSSFNGGHIQCSQGTSALQLFRHRRRIPHLPQIGRGSCREVRSKGCNPFENRESGSRFKYEKGNRLLKEQPDSDSGPPLSRAAKFSSGTVFKKIEIADQGTWDLSSDDNQKQIWKMKSPATEIARSP